MCFIEEGIERSYAVSLRAFSASEFCIKYIILATLITPPRTHRVVKVEEVWKAEGVQQVGWLNISTRTDVRLETFVSAGTSYKPPTHQMFTTKKNSNPLLFMN